MYIDPVEKTVEEYDKIAEDYFKRYVESRDVGIMQPYLDKFLKIISKTNPLVLDVGSGPGLESKYLSDHGAKVVGIDMSVGQLSVAKRNAPNVDFKKMDMRKLKFDKLTFDGVWASASLLHLPRVDISTVVSSFYRVLVDEGVLFLSLKEGKGEGFITNKGDANLEGVTRFFTYYTKDEIVKILESNGFIVKSSYRSMNRNNTWIGFFCRKAI